MSKNKKEKTGSIYFDTTRKTWRCIYYVYESNTGKEIRKTKSFMTEQEAKDFLTSIQYPNRPHYQKILIPEGDLSTE